jgi:hypothetical protein
MTTAESAAAVYAVFSAPIPFGLALVAVGAGIFIAVRWAYVDQLRKAKKYRNRARKDRQRFKLHQDKLMSENQIKEHKIAQLEKEKASLSQAGQNALAELADSTDKTDQTLAELDDDRLETNLDAGSASSVKTK